MPDLVTIFLTLVALAVVVSVLIWYLDRFRNDGADPLTNPDWTLLATLLTRRSRGRRSTQRESEDPQSETTSGPG